jgi:hypothetical protein
MELLFPRVVLKHNAFSIPSRAWEVKMLSPAEFRKLAAQCVDLADSVSPEQRAILLNMAEIWLRLASKAQDDAKRRRDN